MNNHPLSLIQAVEIMFSDDFLYRTPQMKNLVLKDDKGYVKIEELKNIPYLAQYLCELQMTQQVWIPYICEVMKGNSQKLLCRNQRIRRVIPFSDKSNQQGYVLIENIRQTTFDQLWEQLSKITQIYSIKFIQQLRIGLVCGEQPSLLLHNQIHHARPLSKSQIHYYLNWQHLGNQTYKTKLRLFEDLNRSKQAMNNEALMDYLFHGK